MAVSYLRPRPAQLRTGPVKCCPACREVLVGGPTLFYCQPCQRSVPAADVPSEITPLSPVRPAA